MSLQEKQKKADEAERGGRCGHGGLLEAGLDVKYWTMERCRAGTLQQRKTSALAATIPERAAGAEEPRLRGDELTATPCFMLSTRTGRKCYRTARVSPVTVL